MLKSIFKCNVFESPRHNDTWARCFRGEEFLSISDYELGNVRLTNGQISGLATLRRKGEARMHSDCDGATIEAKLVLEQVRLCYDYSAKVGLNAYCLCLLPSPKR